MAFYVSDSDDVISRSRDMLRLRLLQAVNHSKYFNLPAQRDKGGSMTKNTN